jgi:Ca2+-binding EF-hand superfamily protein
MCRLPREQQRRELRLIFDLLDSDGSGEVDERELKSHCRALGIASALQVHVL